MRVVLITRQGCEHAYVANVLCRELPITAVVLDGGVFQTRSRRIRILLKRYSLCGLAMRAAGKLVSVALGDGSRRLREMHKVLGAETCRLQTHDVPVIHVNGINTAESIAKLKVLEPDLFLIYGTGIIGKTVLSMPALGALNMHTGISPYYRGADCAFWPLYNNELHMIGATVHDCTPEVDGGAIHAVKRARLQEDDNLFSVFARSVHAGTEIYVDVVRNIISNGRLSGVKQDFSLGTEYKASMKNVWRELVVRARIRKGLIRRHLRDSATGLVSEPV